MRCPSCLSPDHRRHKAPEEAGNVTLRRHQCQRCGKRFSSVQMPLTGLLADLVEAEMSLLTSSSGQQPQTKDSPGPPSA